MLRHVLRLARHYAPLEYDSHEPVILARLLENAALAEIGARLERAGAVSASDVALLGHREVIRWLEADLANSDVSRIVEKRRGTAPPWSRYTPPLEIAAAGEAPPAPASPPADAVDQYRGQAVSPGLVQGRAHVVDSLSEIGNVMPGEILVCRDMRFEYSPAFDLVAAVVAEEGGLLGHAGVLEREFVAGRVWGGRYLPAPANGDLLTVDATRGVVLRHQVQPNWDSL
jgi:phosphohistidine swiveling domain-containing protein